MLYLSNSDGSNVEKIDLPDMDYVIDPHGHRMDNCSLLAGDVRAAITISTPWIL